MGSKRYLVTGGMGFLGSALVRSLLQVGHQVRVLDNETRGTSKRLADIREEFEFVEADIRDYQAVERAAKGVDSVCHLAFINGTEFFYTKPELVLDVGVKGMIHVIEACRKQNVHELVLASSSEVYQTPPVIPTDETVPLSIPDPLNPRYSYAGGKIVSELMAFHCDREHLNRVMIFRPHNVYGPDMGCEHVIPQFVLRMKELCDEKPGKLLFPIQGTGQETRSFIFIADFINALMLILEKGEHRNIYHIGTSEELTIENVAREVGQYFGRQIEIIPGKLAEGGTLRRCPDIRKITALGFQPQHFFRSGLAVTAKWYDENADKLGKI